MPKFSRRTYVNTAKIISTLADGPDKAMLIASYCHQYKEDNPRFDRDRFIEACRPVKPKPKPQVSRDGRRPRKLDLT